MKWLDSTASLLPAAPLVTSSFKVVSKDGRILKLFVAEILGRIGGFHNLQKNVKPVDAPFMEYI